MTDPTHPTIRPPKNLPRWCFARLVREPGVLGAFWVRHRPLVETVNT